MSSPHVAGDVEPVASVEDVTVYPGYRIYSQSDIRRDDAFIASVHIQNPQTRYHPTMENEYEKVSACCRQCMYD